MWYLWLQILFLLALSALLGAGLAYWWLRGRYEDVTETYSSLVKSSDKSRPDLMERSDLETHLNALSAKIDQIETADLSPLESQILSLFNAVPDTQAELSPLLAEIQSVSEEIRRSEAAAEGFETRLDALETRLSDHFNASMGRLESTLHDQPETDLDPMLSRLEEIQAQVDQLAALNPQIATLSKQTNDLAERQALDMKSEVARLEQKFSSVSDGMLQPIQQNLQALAAKSPDSDSLTQRVEARLQAIEDQLNRQLQSLRPIGEKLDEIVPTAAANASNHRTLAALDQKLIGFDTTISAIKQRMDQIGAILTTLDQRVDTATLESRLDQTSNELTALRNLLPRQTAFEPLEQSLSRLQQMVFNLRERDVATLNSTIRSIENRVDFVGVENRLTSIEYGLAATHHMLRSRLEQSADLPPAPQREPYREPPRDYAFTPQSTLRPPEAALDPIDMIRTTDTASNLLLEPGFGQADNLEKIRGIGPMLRQLLNDTGVFYYWQIAEWSEQDVASVDALLPGYQGRITRDRWVEQARELADLPGAAQRPQPFGRDG
ncbi:MAG: hypothetical protein AAFZ74_01900 [Pseudomonadota bacterium]